jgi:RNA polymerase sigma factor (TIGR02999 family)
MSDVTRLLEEARQGDRAAWHQAVALVYQDLKRIARVVLGGGGSATCNPTQLVHEAYLRLAKAGPEGVLNRAHFLAVAAQAMRQLMLNHARDKLAVKRGGGAPHTGLDEVDAAMADEAHSLLALDTALRRLEAEDERKARVVECRIFAGLGEQETADALDLPLRTSQRLWAEARARLSELLEE